MLLPLGGARKGDAAGDPTVRNRDPSPVGSGLALPGAGGHRTLAPVSAPQATADALLSLVSLK